MSCRVVVAGLEIVEAGFFVVAVAAITQGGDVCECCLRQIQRAKRSGAARKYSSGSGKSDYAATGLVYASVPVLLVIFSQAS